MSTDARSSERSQAVFAAVRSLGLVGAKDAVEDPPLSTADCPCGKGQACGHLGTWGPWELDHLFLSPALADQVASVQIDAFVVTSGLSDHAPVILDLDLSPEPTAHSWDEDAFSEEIARRHGSEARRVVDRLVSWAFQKDRTLAGETGLQTRTLSRFPTNGTTTEPELSWQLDFALNPRSTQSLMALNARGDVILPFNGMWHPPFSDVAGREFLREMLNELDGVDIPAGDLSARTRFPLALLKDEANLMKFVAVLDRMADESRPRGATS